MLRVMGSVEVVEEVEESGDELTISSKRDKSMSSRDGVSIAVTSRSFGVELSKAGSIVVEGDVVSREGSRGRGCLLFFFRPYFLPSSASVWLMRIQCWTHCELFERVCSVFSSE